MYSTLPEKYRIPKWRCIADEDGVGGGVVDNCDIQGFVNNSRALRMRTTKTCKHNAVTSWQNT